MDINDVVSAYLAAKQAESAAKKQAAAMKSLILDHARGADNFTTDIYTVVIKTTTSTRLDTGALYADFPDIKREYGKASTSTEVSAVLTAGAEKKSA